MKQPQRSIVFATAVGLVCWASMATARAGETTRYVLLTGTGTVGGEQVVERGDDGLTTVRFSFKNNGRGPELTERIQRLPDGTIARYEVQGTSTMGATVDERYSREGDQAQWQSTTERGSTRLSGSALYVPLSGSFEITSMSIGALAARADSPLPLLPSGQLTQKQLAEVDLEHEGQRRRVQLLAQTGLGLTPAFYWATVGPEPRLFAAHYPGWMTAIEAGWQGVLPQLAQRQQQAEATVLRDLAQRLRTPLPGLTVVRNARIFDSETARLGAPSDVYVLRGRITAVTPAGRLSVAAGRPDGEIDAAGRVMLPGLFDMHGHVDRWDGGLHLAAGVTTVRDMGNDNLKLQQMMDEAVAGQLLLPQVVPTGLLEGESASALRLGFVIETLQQAKDAVDWYAARGYVQLKIYNSFPREMLREVVAHAHRRGLRVSGHVPVFMRAQDVLAQGFDEIQHINQVLLNFLVTPTTDTRTLARFYLPAERLASLDLDAKPVQNFLAELRRRQTVIDPTLVTFDFLRQRDGELSAPFAPIVAHLPPDVQRGFYQGSMKIGDDATAARFRQSYAKMVDFVGRMHRAGVPLVAGTDHIAGFTLHSELALYVQAGLTPAQALQVATRNGSRYAGTRADRGRIAVGQRADLLLVDGDPTRQIDDLRKVALVITQSSVISPAAVHAALGIRPFVTDPPSLRAISP